MKPVNSVRIIGDFFRLSYVENTGVAFGQLQGKTLFLILPSVICLIILIYMLKSSSSRIEILGFFLIFSGAIGNLIDRIFRGYVIDFLDFDFFDIHFGPLWYVKEVNLQRWPVFNFADSCIFIGAVIILIYVFMNIYNKKQDNVSSSI